VALNKGVSRKLAVILHADVVDSTALVRLDETLAHQRIQDAFQRFSHTVETYGGTAHELRGDALVAEFDRASDAVCAALLFQDENKAFNEALDDELRPALRIGISMGEVVVADSTLTGEGVVLAQRLEQLADAGGVCIQGAARETVPQRLPFSYEDLGEQDVKGFADPVRAFKVGLPTDKSVPEPEKDTRSVEAVESRWERRGWLLGSAASLIFVVAGVLAWLQPWQPDVEPASVERMAFPLPDKPSIAVLPFANLNNDPDQDFFSDGISNDIMTELSRFDDLLVIASNSTFHYKGKPTKVQQVAEELGVQYVLEGSVQRTGDKVRINVQLIDALAGTHLWADRYDREATDLFAVQDEITQHVVAKLGAFGGRVADARAERARRKATVDLNAYELVLLAVEHRHRFTKEDNAKSIELLDRAIELDPQYARAHTEKAWGHAMNIWRGYVDTGEESFERALKSAKRGVELDPSAAIGHWALGDVLLSMGNIEKGVASFRRALDRNPNNADLLASWGGWVMGDVLGETEEGIETVKWAMRLNPYYLDFYDRGLIVAYFAAREYENAISAFNGIEHVTFNDRLVLITNLAHAGRLDEARTLTDQILESRPEFAVSAVAKGLVYSKAGYEHLLDGLRKAGMPENPPLALPDEPSIAVLPFANLNNDPSQDFFSDGITNDIITELYRFTDLMVIASNSVFHYKGKPTKVQQIAKELGVRYVLEGSVQRVDNKVRINVQFIDASTGGHLWAERYDRKLDDIFAIQDEITHKVAATLGAYEGAVAQADLARAKRKSATNLNAYELVLLAREHRHRWNAEDNAKALALLQKAAELDPQYARAHVGLAWTHGQNAWQGFVDTPDASIKQALESAKRAVELDPAFAEAHMALGELLMSTGNREKGVASFRRAVELNPNHADILAGWGGLLAEALGETAEGIKTIKRAMRLSPHHADWMDRALMRAYMVAERYEDAIATYEDLDHETLNAQLFLVASYAHAGRMEEARTAAARVLESHPKFTVSAHRSLSHNEATDARWREGLRMAGLPE
jgi:adenylate cyclase